MAEETPTEQKKKERKRKAPAAPPPRLRERYRSEVLPALQRELEIANPMRVPRLEKIVINMGVGDAIRDAKLLDAAVADLATITGQKPVITRARKSIAQFKLREGMAIGAKVTLRGARMWEFLDRLLSTALPRIRDFRGLNSDAFDGSGNYSVGVTEQLIFPEIDYDKVVKVRGMDITVVTTALGDDEARSLLRALGFPFAGQPAVSAA
jgi:large subunit ribosomal protein L5